MSSKASSIMLENTHHANWDDKVARQTGWCHFLQSAEWAQVQDKNHWSARLTEVNDYPLVLYRRQAAGLGYVYQIPKMARLPLKEVRGFSDVLEHKSKDGLVVKIDIDGLYDEELHRELLQNGWRRVPSIQYRETVLIDLTKSHDELLKSFKKRARTELNAGLRRGVKVEKLEVNKQNTARLYHLLQKTYDRAGFITRKRGFTEAYWQEFARAGHGSMYIASHEGRELAAAYIIHIGERAFYKDGASIRIKPDVFASRVMQWQIIQDMKEQGYKQYDLCGVSTEGGSSIAGVSLFKTGFGEPVRLQWGYELPLSDWRYRLWKTALERPVIKYSQSVKKELWY